MGTSCFPSFGVITTTILMSILCFCFSVYGSKSCLIEERAALLQLRDSFNYPNSYIFSDWVGDGCCEWTSSIECDNTYHVIGIYIESPGEREVQFEKWYPNASLFTHFKELKYLSLRYIDIGGWIMPQALCELRNLKSLDLSGNSLDDGGLPRCLAHDLPSLEAIYLDDNSLSLSSPLLSALCGLKNLCSLGLSSNILSNGSLPPCMLDTFSTLESLDLSNFTLEESSNVITALHGARNLQKLNLRSNNLSAGTVGALCGVTMDLRNLDLSNSYLNVQHIPPCLRQNQSSLESLALTNVTFAKHSRALLKGLTCGWKKLKMLNLNMNDLSDEDLPSCLFYNSSMLEGLDLSSNNLSGSLGFSRGLCKLRKLQQLDLSMNSIQNIPWTCLSQLDSLDTLYLFRNQIAGTIAAPLISNMTSLSFFDLSENKLEGVVFLSMFANHSRLTGIGLSNNRDLEVETEYPTWIPSFQLSFLGLDNCKLRTIPHFISTQYNLYDLFLSYNSLQGTIPSWLFYNATLYFLNLKGNQLHGPFPLPFKNETSNLGDLDISDNKIQGKLPKNMDVLFPNLLFLNLSTNKLQGRIPSSFGYLNVLGILDLSNNYFVGEVPQELTQNNTSLLSLILSRNNLHAMPRVTNMTNLNILRLDGNLFTRPFPITPSSVPSLAILDISGNSIFGSIQDWLLPTTLPNLISLLMRENHFVGSLPPSLCQMNKLRVLDLSDNNLSGTIPSCLNNITSWLKESEVDVTGLNLGLDLFYINFVTKGNWYLYKGRPLDQMTGIDLSLNQLSGDIPFQMGELGGLRSLNLSHNSLTGDLPESFQELKLVESLDLSHNMLVGIVPPQMVQLSFLSTFSVAFNQLSGMIPYENNFATFTKESYVGNLGLCGPPIEVNCSTPQPHQNKYREGDDEEQSLLDNNLFFYSYVAICFLLGFWAIVAPLLLSKNWRRKYYKIVDRCIDWWSQKMKRL